MTNKLRRNITKWSIILLLTATLFSTIKIALDNRSQNSEGNHSLYSSIRASINHQISINFMPILSFLNNRDAAGGPSAYLETALLKQMPLYYYSERLTDQEPEREDELTRDMIIRQEGSDESEKNISESDLDYTDSAMHIEESLMESMLDENIPDMDDAPSDSTSGTDDSMYTPSAFTVPAYPSYTYDWSEDFGYDDLIANFYAIDSITAITDKSINLDNLLNQDLTIDRDTDGPQILIYHTHSQEGFVDSVPGDPSTTIMGAGERLAALLQDRYGFKVLHHTGQYDLERRDYAYSNAMPAIEQLLADNPTIEVVIDLHRDEMAEGRKLVMELQGRPTARFMFFNGISYTKQNGAIDYLENPNLNDNLAFSFQEQVVANEYYPGLARKIYLRAYRYNMHLMPRYTLIELGAQTNTVEEIMNACDPLAHIIATVLTRTE